MPSASKVTLLNNLNSPIATIAQSDFLSTGLGSASIANSVIEDCGWRTNQRSLVQDTCRHLTAGGTKQSPGNRAFALAADRRLPCKIRPVRLQVRVIAG